MLKNIEPPSGNTGVESEKLPEIGVDWLAGTFKGDVFQHVSSLIRGTFQEEFLQEEFSLRWYERARKTPNGIRFAWQPRQGGVVGDRCESHLDICGSALSGLSHLQILRLLKSLQSIGFSCSRIDVKLDDFSKIVTPALAYEAWKNGNVSGFQVHKWTTSGRFGEECGETLSLGRRGSNGSGKYLRIYNKTVQSCGLIDATRIELEMSDIWAKDAFKNLCSIDENSLEMIPQMLAGYISGAVDFIDKSVDPDHASRCPRLSWWDAIIGEFAKFKASRIYKTQTLEKAKKWLFKQVAPTFAMLMSIMQQLGGTDMREELFWQLWIEGEKRMNETQKLILMQSIP